MALILIPWEANIGGTVSRLQFKDSSGVLTNADFQVPGSAISASYNLDCANTVKLSLKENIDLFNQAVNQSSENFDWLSQTHQTVNKSINQENQKVNQSSENFDWLSQTHQTVNKSINQENQKVNQFYSTFLLNNKTTTNKIPLINFQSSTKLIEDKHISLSTSNKTHSSSITFLDFMLNINVDSLIDYNFGLMLSKMSYVPVLNSLFKQVPKTIEYKSYSNILQKNQILYSNFLLKTSSKTIPANRMGIIRNNSQFRIQSLALLNSNLILNRHNRSTVDINKRFKYQNLESIIIDSILNTQYLTSVSESNLIDIDYQLTKNIRQNPVFDSQKSLDLNLIVPLSYRKTSSTLIHNVFPLSSSNVLYFKQTTSEDHQIKIQKINLLPLSFRLAHTILIFKSIPYEIRAIKDFNNPINFGSLAETFFNKLDIPYSFLLSNILVTTIQDMPVNWKSGFIEQHIVPIEYKDAFVVPVVDDPERIWTLDNRDFVWIVLK